MKFEYYDVIILGGGAAGLMAGASAASRGRSVLVLEKSNMVGKKILMSGGGRCNFTNLNVTPENFISNNPYFPTSALSRYRPEDFIYLVESHGINYEERKHGQLFCKGSSREVLNALIKECSRNEVFIQTNYEITEIVDSSDRSNRIIPKHPNSNFIIKGINRNKKSEERSEYCCESLIVATGGLSIPTLGGSGFGYELAEKCDVEIRSTQPGLVPFVLEDNLLKDLRNLSGVSVLSEIRCHQQSFSESFLFTHKGLSGPSVLQISNYWKPGDFICINLIPEIETAPQFEDLILRKPNVMLRTAMKDFLPKSLVSYLENNWWNEHRNIPINKIPQKIIKEIYERLGNWKICPAGTEGYRTAEVTLGGVDTNSVSSKTFEVKKYKGLYFVGEVLDVTGQLGGYNFQWAWASGYAAGSFA